VSPSVPSRPVPAPRQFQSFTNINILSPDFQDAALSLGQYKIDSSNLEEVQVKKIAQKFQSCENMTIERQTRNVKEETPASNVIKIVSRINALSATA